jgi:hypothetical protein
MFEPSSIDRRAARSILRTSALLLVVIATGCSGTDDSTGEGTGEIQLEQALIPTQLKELRAGAGYLPGIDESPILAANPCLKDPKVIVRGGNVTSSAAIVQSRSSLNLELGLEANVLVPVGGFTGAASLTAKTTFDSRSAAVIFQTTGTYESSVNVSDLAKDFDMASVSKCGYGFVSRAQHRVAAALVVQMQSTASNLELGAKANAGKASVVDLKGSLSTAIQKGHVNLTVRFAADVIPDVPAPPFAEASVLTVGDGDSEKQAANAKIEAALSWLANANTAVQKYVLALQQDSNSSPPAPAPTEKVSFKYYPSTPPEVRAAIEQTARNAVAIRQSLGDTQASIASWETFVKSAKDGHGFEWNVAAEPATTVDALRAKSDDLIVTNGGKLKNYADDLSSALEGCSLALRNEKSAAQDVVLAALKDGCKPPAASPVDKAKANIRPIAVLSALETDGSSRSCATGMRLPTQKEANIFSAWSSARKAAGSGGLWTQDGPSCTFSGFSWLNDGKVECSGVLTTKTGLSLCVSQTTGPFPEQ